MNHTLLLLGQISSLSAKIAGALFLAYIYWKHRRKPALCWSLSWIAAASSILSDITGNMYIVSLSEAFWAMFLFYGTILLLEEEGITNREVGVLSIIPVITSLYGILIGNLGRSSDWFALLGLPYAVSALFITSSGLMILFLRKLYDSKALYLGGVITLYGLHELDYPVLRLVEWFAPIGFALGAIFSILSAYVMIKFVFTEEFIRIERPPVEMYLKPGVMIIKPEEYNTIKEKLEKVPVLAFVRSLHVPESWNAFFITTTGERNSIFPTDLAKIVDITVRYLREAKEKGFEGIIVIDCPEYLKTYNGFEALVKFLASLKDFTLLYNGVLILVIEEEAWEKRELKILKRVLT
ncbi:DUF835 domain-containing protein [Thermococcus alcaliphilus]|uniref:DUF835 domain-containing protein n=1 Tax=Thermococcus alcaliphilus TaxID=139207 RepID=UPI002091B6D7|nr:DUF835 domain-containing protein [Thermococcus alcaliphilus]MCO6040863.1 DUF835 domain-containing protein [Thermococcus alcaliphilus]